MMLLYPYRYTAIALMLAFCCVPPGAHGQASTWGSADATKAMSSKKKSASQKAKDYKKHLEQWGMDSSYNHTLLLGGKLNSDGWSGCVQLLKRKNYKANTIWQASFSEIKHEKQSKQQGMSDTLFHTTNATPYVYGKINNLYTLQLGVGRETLLLPAVMEGNISVGFRYTCGLSLAMLKPYYLKLLYVNYYGPTPVGTMEQQSYNHADSAQFLNHNAILGASAWTKGLGEITYVPGAYFEAAITIMPGKSKALVEVITLGVNAALYAQTLPIMADQTAYPWQVSLFAGLGIGKRWR